MRVPCLLSILRFSVSESLLTVPFGVCRVLKSLCHDSKEIANAANFVNPLTLSALSANEARRRICRELRKLTTDETLGLIYKRRDVMVAEIQKQQVANNSFFLESQAQMCAGSGIRRTACGAHYRPGECGSKYGGSLYQLFLAGMNQSNRPLGTLLFLGPTGSGKTRVVEAAAEILFGDVNAVIKIELRGVSALARGRKVGLALPQDIWATGKLRHFLLKRTSTGSKRKTLRFRLFYLTKSRRHRIRCGGCYSAFLIRRH